MTTDTEALRARLAAEIARIIDPANFSMTPEAYGVDDDGFKKTMAYGSQLVAFDKAEMIVAKIEATALRQKDEEIARLRAALEPFSVAAGVLFSHNYNDSDTIFGRSFPDGDSVHITFFTFRRARTALNGGSNER